MAEEEEEDPTIKIPTEEIVPNEAENSGIIYNDEIYNSYAKNNRELDAHLRLKEQQAQESNDGFAWGMGAATELSAGFAGSYGYARWAQGGIGALRGLKGISNLAVVGGPVGWGGKAVTHTLANAGIWALANTLGQGVRNSLSDNTKWSAGELLAASLLGGAAGPSSRFGMFVDTKLAKQGKQLLNKSDDFVFKIGGEKATESALFKGAVKVSELGAKGTTRFLGGGSFALAETIVRQELQLVLNERDSRDTKEWKYAIVLGGALNVTVRGGIDVLSQSKLRKKITESFNNTPIGRTLMRRSIRKGNETLKVQEEKAKKLIKDLEKNPRNNPEAEKPNWNEIDLLVAEKSRLAQIKEAQFILKDFEKGFNKHSEKLGDDIPQNKPEQKALETEELTVTPERDIKAETEKLIEDFNAKKIEGFENLKKNTEARKKLKDEGEDVAPEKIEVDDNAQFRARAREMSEYLETQEQELTRQYVRVRKGKEQGSPLGTIKQLIDNVENQISLNTRALDRLDYDWAKSGHAKQARNKDKDWASEALLISKRAVIHNSTLVDQVKAYKEYIKYGEEFSDLSAILTGSKLATGSKTAAQLVEDHVKRINDKIGKIETKLNEDLAPDAAVSVFTASEIKGKASSDTKHLKSYLKSLEKSKKTAAEFDEIKTKLDNKLAVSMEEFNALSKQQRSELIKGRAEKLNTTEKKLTAEIAALKKNALAKSKKLEKDALKREEAEFLRSMKKAYEDGADVNWISKEGVKRGIRSFFYASKLAYIGQVASIVPSITTGAYTLAYRSFSRPLARFLAENKTLHPTTLTKKSKKQFWTLAAMDAFATLSMIKELPSIPRSTWKSWKELKSHTRGGELEAGYAESSKIALNNNKAKINAIADRGDKEARALVAKTNLTQKLKKLGGDGLRGAEQLLLLNVRNLTAVDDVFFRLGTRQEIEAKAGAQAVREFPDDFKRMFQRKNELVNKWMPKDADGMRRLNMSEELEEFWSGLNEDIMWKSSHKDYTHADTIKDAEKFIDSFQNFKRTSKRGFETEIGELVISPYTSIGVRTMLLSMKYMSSPLRVFPHADKLPILTKAGAGATTGNNPYKRRIDDLTKKINRYSDEIRQGKIKDSVGDDIPLTPENIKKKRDAKIEAKQQRKNLEAQRIEYNITEYQRAMAAAGMYAVGTTLGGLGIYHGTNLWKTQKQRDHDKMAGITPNSIETPDGPIRGVNSAGAQMAPMQLGASQATWDKLKAEGKLKEDQTWPKMMLSNFMSPYMDSPFNQGARAVGKALYDKEFDGNFWAGIFGGILPAPAEIRNFNKILRGDGNTKDLKGGTFLERALYQKWGTGLVENNFDVLGRPTKETKNILSSLGRWLPYDENIHLNTDLRAFERVALDDTHGIMPTRFLPTDNFVYNEKCRDWRNEEGYTIRTEFARRLREEYGSLQDEVNALIEEIGEETFRTEGEGDTKEGVTIAGRLAYEELSKTINNAYTNVRNSFEIDIENNAQYLNKYVSRKNGDQGFLDYIQNKLANDQGDDSVKKRASDILRYKFNID